jgi:glyoxylase-like metal-dependent hydrolase (beta-lactamase superfamily II)
MSDATPLMSRRTALRGAVALPFIGGLLGKTARPAAAAAEMKGMGTSLYNRFKLGNFEVTALLAGTRTVPEPQTIFGMNVSADEFATVSQAAHIPTDKAQFFFTPTVVNTGSELVLFDTGLNGAGITSALTAAGYSPDQVDTVVLTHMHGDHIGGLMTDGAPTFANARYVTGSAEHNHWSAAGNEGFDNNVKPLNEKMAFIEDGGSVAGGITAISAPGHTPGHMGYMVESGGQQLALVADLANHYVWSLAYPDWEVKFDMDKAMAAASRRQVLGMLASDKVPMIGYHMPWPAMGYVESRDDGFRFVPASYQMMME